MADLSYPADLKYAESDEWVRVEGDIATLGISDYAQEALNDLVYAEFKAVGDTLAIGDSFGEIESVKAVVTIGAPSEPAHVSHQFGYKVDEIEKEGIAKHYLKINGQWEDHVLTALTLR